MQIVHADAIDRRRGLEHRGGTFFSRTLVHGTPGTADNFKLSLSEGGMDHFGPRHRHNFDQYRFMISGASNFDRDGLLEADMLGYFPEGVYYGPQTNPANTFVVVLQFGGASGSGYLLPAEVKAGTEELKKLGEFRDGTFYPREGVTGLRETDGFQAIWEHVNGRPMDYPAARYETPIFMRAANFDWVAISKGVEERLFGTFTERRTSAAQIRIAAGHMHQVEGRGLWLVLDGAGTMGGEAMRKYTALFLEAGERSVIAASETTTLLHYGLPNLADMAGTRHRPAVAAE
jgi:hypothetical protein